MNAATMIRSVRERAGISKRELARRAGTSPAAIVIYEQGSRDPTVDTLMRIVAAAGADAEVRLATRRGPDPDVNGRRLAQVLELADHLPRRPAARRIAYPKFGG